MDNYAASATVVKHTYYPCTTTERESPIVSQGSQPLCAQALEKKQEDDAFLSLSSLSHCFKLSCWHRFSWTTTKSQCSPAQSGVATSFFSLKIPSHNSITYNANKSSPFRDINPLVHILSPRHIFVIEGTKTKFFSIDLMKSRLQCSSCTQVYNKYCNAPFL